MGEGGHCRGEDHLGVLDLWVQMLLLRESLNGVRGMRQMIAFLRTNRIRFLYVVFKQLSLKIGWYDLGLCLFCFCSIYNQRLQPDSTTLRCLEPGCKGCGPCNLLGSMEKNLLGVYFSFFPFLSFWVEGRYLLFYIFGGFELGWFFLYLLSFLWLIVGVGLNSRLVWNHVFLWILFLISHTFSKEEQLSSC